MRVGLRLVAVDLCAGPRTRAFRDPRPVRLVLQGCVIAVGDQGQAYEYLTLAGVGTAGSDDAAKPRGFYATMPLEPLQDWLENNSVSLIHDTRTTTDPQGRRIAYAMEPGGRRDWGWSLIRAGYGYARRDYNYDQKPQYLLAEQAARRERRGMWKDYIAPSPPVVETPHIPMLAVSPSQYSDGYKRSLYRSIKTRNSMHRRSVAARNGRSSSRASFDFEGGEDATEVTAELDVRNGGAVELDEQERAAEEEHNRANRAAIAKRDRELSRGGEKND